MRTPVSCRIAVAALPLFLLAPAAARAMEKEVSLVTKQPVGELAVAGRLSVDLHAEFMVARTYEKETVLNWYTCGYSGGGSCNKVGGNFGNFGLDVPWKERDDRYPRAVTVDKVPAVRFDGSDILKGNFAVEKAVAGAQAMALELWLRVEGPAKGMVVLGWQSPDGSQASAPLACPDALAGSPAWRHLVVNCTPEKEDWYLDGRKISGGKRAMLVAEGHVLVLGGATAKSPSFKGDLAAVRLHDAAMTEEEIAHNVKGGPMLGTEMHSWWRLEPDKWWAKESVHFRHCVDKGEMAKWNEKQLKEFNDRVPGMFDLAELIYRTYSERLAMRSSVVSRRPERRGDGIKYKTPIQPAGGSFMGCDDDFGWACQGAGHINPHELVHGWQAMTGGALQGNWWEAHANFPQTYNGIYQTAPPGCCSRVCAYFPANGRCYYHERLLFEHLAQTPEYGPMFISKLWYDGATETDKNPYPWVTFTRFDPDPATPLATEVARMVMRNVTWDYTTFEDARGGKGNTGFGNDHVLRAANLYQEDAKANRADILRYARIQLQRIPYDRDWWRVPKELSPQQLGWNICPLKVLSPQVSAVLTGYVNPKRGSDWRAAFVGVNAQGKPVYGDIAGPGKTLQFHAGGDIQELYLVVCAVPTNVMAINMVGDFRSFEQEPFPYKVKFQGCEPLDVLAPEKPAAAGAPHPNGGGFVDSRAQVDATAFVAAGARVLGKSQVLGQARILDHAVVQDSTVRDRAVVSGHALVAQGSVVQDDAKVRDFGRVWHATVKDRARILEHAEQRDKPCGGNAVLKGGAISFGPVSGNSLIDGSYAKGNVVDKGKWFTWSWGTGKNAGEIDQEFGGLYLRMTFEEPHPWMAVDDFGSTWGYLAGSPTVATAADSVGYKSTLMEPESVVPSLEAKPDVADNFVALFTGYVIPPADGEYTFWIAADDEGECWLGKAGSDTADRKICFNPFYAERNNYRKFPSQKSEPVRLEKGKACPIRVLYGDGHMGDSLSVVWTRPGSDKPEIIGPPHLSVTPDGKKPGLVRRAWSGVAKVADLVTKPDFPEGRVRVAGGVLVLNGKDQFVELTKDVADLREATYRIRLSWQGGPNERIFDFSNDKGDSVSLSPSSGGKCAFVITKGGKAQTLAGPALQAGKWADVAVVLSGEGGKLFIDGKKVAEDRAMTIRPDDVENPQCYLGRGREGGFFNGRIDRFEVWSVALEEAELGGAK
jgi:hypothetical protein